MNFSKEELIRAYENGTLQSLLLGCGMLPLTALEQLLEELSSEDA